ncbi:hypothetical protein ABT008_12890 [Micromonospora sp. NPDC002389]|uniref:hypothetical protein n=1 Tax=Micromonospora sp. NPDC002389 TaxID=3154272 RepID=UPI00332ECA08
MLAAFGLIAGWMLLTDYSGTVRKAGSILIVSGLLIAGVGLARRGRRARSDSTPAGAPPTWRLWPVIVVSIGHPLWMGLVAGAPVIAVAALVVTTAPRPSKREEVDRLG